MTKRKPIPKKIRFEVLRRDGFTCQYCGSAAPEVKLHIDHIDPVSAGGGNEIINLITSCETCNIGKGARKLDDSTTLQKQRQQLIELNERREQLEMMMEWRAGLQDELDAKCDMAAEYFIDTFGGFCINEHGIGPLKRHITKFGLQTVLDAIDAGYDTYCRHGVDEESVQRAFNKLGGICANLRNPESRELAYIRGIIRNRFNYVNDGVAAGMLKRARSVGVDIELLREIARTERNWTRWKEAMEAATDDQEVEE